MAYIITQVVKVTAGIEKESQVFFLFFCSLSKKMLVITISWITKLIAIRLCVRL